MSILKKKEIKSMDTQKIELNEDDLSALVLLQSLDEFDEAQTIYGEEVTSLREKLDQYEEGMTFGYDELDMMDQSIENLEAAGLLKVDPNDNEIYILPQGKDAVNAITGNGDFSKDSLETGEKVIKGLTLNDITQAMKRFDKAKLLKNLDRVLAGLSNAVTVAGFIRP